MEPIHLRFSVSPASIPDPVLNFGAHKGQKLSQIPLNYVQWLATGGANKKGTTYRLDPKIVDAARIRSNADVTLLAKKLMGGLADPERPIVYLITREGDIEGMTVHESLDAALTYLSEEYPLATDRDPDDVSLYRYTPDPEDDRILIWEVLPSGHRKQVMHFSGWHYSSDNLDCPPITLPGDPDTLYKIACDE